MPTVLEDPLLENTSAIWSPNHQRGRYGVYWNRFQSARFLIVLVMLVVGFSVRVYSITSIVTMVDLHFLKAPPSTTSLINFSFPQMVSDFWASKAYMLALMIVLGSSVLPVVSVVYMAAYMMMRPSFRKREVHVMDHLLNGLDAATKLSLIDVFFLSYLVCLLKADVVVVGVHAARVDANPVFGLYTGICSTLFLMICFRVLKFMMSDHAKLLETEVLQGVEVEHEIEELLDMEVSTASDRSLLRHAATVHNHGWLVATVFLGYFVTIVLAIVLCFLYPVVSFELQGLIAGVVEPDQVVKTFHFLSVSGMMLNSTDENWVGPAFISIVYTMVVFVIPSINVVVMFACWLLPMTNKQRKYLANGVIKVFFNLSCLDVLFVSTVIAHVEMHLVVEWVISDKYEKVCDLVKKETHEPCVGLGGSIGTGLWMVALSCILYYVLFAVTQLAIARIGESRQVE